MFLFELMGILFLLLLVLFGGIMILSYSNHYLILLLSVEMILLGVLSLLYCKDSMQSSLPFLLLMACMGGFGVSLVVSLFRGVGKDFFSYQWL